MFEERNKMEDTIVAQALVILDSRLREPGALLSSPTAVKNFLRLKLVQEEREVFALLFLDVKNRLIACELMFNGTLTSCSVYPREVVKAALNHNAHAVILSHNHPSGSAEPSESDCALTCVLKDALAMVDVKVLDHIIVGGGTTHSFAEHCAI